MGIDTISAKVEYYIKLCCCLGGAEYINHVRTCQKSEMEEEEDYKISEGRISTK